ncbi:hypothetical protein KSP39_PZI006639 [Platanthera zijinensis]|uniref:peptidylprolyl isomerase n=1 Tax=Platanthera zijinensis TaxID=2320716 RepID=A0AAP0BQV6_9ASPA
MVLGRYPFTREVAGRDGGRDSEIIGENIKVDFPRVLSLQRKVLAVFMKNESQGTIKSMQNCEVGAQNVNLSTKKFKDFIVSTSVGTNQGVKVTVDVSGARTQEIFDDVFAKLVEAAQPIPGFRRVKGGKTLDIPKDVLLHILGPSKVNKETILSVINTTVAEFVEKEGLDVSGDLRVEQSYADIEAAFVPGKEFSFEAIIHCKPTSKS